MPDVKEACESFLFSVINSMLERADSKLGIERARKIGEEFPTRRGEGRQIP